MPCELCQRPLFGVELHVCAPCFSEHFGAQQQLREYDLYALGHVGGMAGLWERRRVSASLDNALTESLPASIRRERAARWEAA